MAFCCFLQTGVGNTVFDRWDENESFPSCLDIFDRASMCNGIVCQPTTFRVYWSKSPDIFLERQNMCFGEPDVRSRSQLARLSEKSDLRDRVNAEFSDVWTRKKRNVDLPQAPSHPTPGSCSSGGQVETKSVFRDPPRLLKKNFDIRPDQPCSCLFTQA